MTPSAAIVASAYAAAAVAVHALGVSWSAVTGFAALAVFGLYLPGRLFVPERAGGVEVVAAAVLVAWSGAGLLWGAALLLGLPPRSMVAVLAVLAAAAIVRGRWRIPPIAAATATAAVSVAVAGTVAFTQFGNGVVRADGGFAFQSRYAPEALFHSAITQELRHALPMDFPPGTTFGYHVLYNLVEALAAEITGASVVDLHYRLMPLVLVPLSVLAAAAFASALGATPRQAAFGALFLWMADDLSWVFGVSGMRSSTLPLGDAWELWLGVPVCFVLQTNRQFLLGLSFFFVALAAAVRFLRHGRWSDALLAGWLVAVSFETKVFFYLLALAAIVAAGFLLRPTAPSGAKRARRAAALAALTVLFSLPFGIFTIATYRTPAAPFIVFPGYLGLRTLVGLGFFPTWEALKESLHRSPPWVGAGWLAAGSALETAGTLGARALGVAWLWERRRAADPAVTLVSTVAGLGLAVSFLLLMPESRDGAGYFWGIALAVLAVLGGSFAAERLERLSPPAAAALALLLAALALPSALQMLWVERSFGKPPVVEAPPGTAAVIDDLAAHARPGSVLLEPATGYSFLATAAPVRSVLTSEDWVRQYCGRDVVIERRRDVHAFFSSGDPRRMLEVLARYGVSWVWLPTGFDLPALPQLELETATPAGRLYRVAPG